MASEKEFNDNIAQLPAQTLVVVYFHAPWAAPCKQMSTILTTLASTYEASTPPQIVFLSIDAEEMSDLAEEYGVTQVPLVALQKDGQKLETIMGTNAAKVRDAIEQHYGRGKNAAGLPPAQQVTKQQQDTQAGSTSNGGLAQYKPDSSDPQTAPQFSDGALNGEQVKEALNKRLAELVKAAPIMLFMKGTPSAPQCGFSRQTVSILREKGVRYGFFNILADDEVRQGLKEFSEWPTFPQVYLEGELIGGLDIVSAAPGSIAVSWANMCRSSRKNLKVTRTSCRSTSSRSKRNQRRILLQRPQQLMTAYLV